MGWQFVVGFYSSANLTIGGCVWQIVFLFGFSFLNPYFVFANRLAIKVFNGGFYFTGLCHHNEPKAFRFAASWVDDHSARLYRTEFLEQTS